MITIRYVTNEDKRFWFELDKHLPEAEFDKKVRMASSKEYLDYILSIKTVENLDEAIAHINEHSTGHSECIISNIEKNIDKFQKEIDSACVYANVSTRFSDGFEFGLGAEIGISTQKLHARGPMGLKELSTYKYIIKGNGQVRP